MTQSIRFIEYAGCAKRNGLRIDSRSRMNFQGTPCLQKAVRAAKSKCLSETINNNSHPS